MEPFELAYFNLIKRKYRYPEKLAKPVYKKGIVGKIKQFRQMKSKLGKKKVLIIILAGYTGSQSY